MRRVAVVVGTRPEAIKLAPVVQALRAEPWAEVRVIATAQHRELLDQVLALFDVRADRDLDLMRPGQSLAEFAARALAALDLVLAEERPDCVLAQGDTTTTLVAALGAYYRRIPFAHVEAGLRTGDRDRPFPEEVHRAMAARCAALHFAPTPQARANLLREGIAAETIAVVGNTAVDAVLWASARTDPARRPTVGEGTRLILVTVHRREHFGAELGGICRAIRTLAARGVVAVLYPVHPNPEVRAVVQRALGGHARIVLAEPLGYLDIVAAMQVCTLILTDSGGIQAEAPALAKPVLVLRRSTERQESVACGAAELVGTDPERIVAAAARLLDDPAAYARMAQVRYPYGDGQSARAIAAALRRFLAPPATPPPAADPGAPAPGAG
jgi:UDP-N-acetylglucosamine 2-epimerase (non-hydrolysing)